jgi:hypothetical protein
MPSVPPRPDDSAQEAGRNQRDGMRPVAPSVAAADAGTRDAWRKTLTEHLREQLLGAIAAGRGERLSEQQLRPQLVRLAGELATRHGEPFEPAELQGLVEQVLEEVFGYGPIQGLMTDHDITDILINGPRQVFIEKRGQLSLTEVTFRDEAHLMQIVERMLAGTNRSLDHNVPLVDARLPDGSRINLVTKPPALNGPLVSIRRFGARPLTVADLLAKIARGMQKAHEAGIIHRDLKPDNIMIDKDGEPVVMDFGLARRFDEDIHLTSPGRILGTPAYMSPEQVESDPQKIGPPTDIYSLGVILYQLLAGRLPFKGSLTSVLRQIGSNEPPRPSTVNPELAAGSPLEPICLKMMAKSPAHRHSCMADVVHALEQAFTAPPPPVAKPSVWKRMWSWMGRRREAPPPAPQPPAPSPLPQSPAPPAPDSLEQTSADLSQVPSESR